ncbi:MAG: hypothetical protein KJ621_01570 [Proteobacteria bacterium]|nr:hypothetical protein [Pseudomonadota bacterium]
MATLENCLQNRICRSSGAATVAKLLAFLRRDPLLDPDLPQKTVLDPLHLGQPGASHFIQVDGLVKPFQGVVRALGVEGGRRILDAVPELGLVGVGFCFQFLKVSRP